MRLEYANRSQGELAALFAELQAEYEALCKQGLKLDMSRGKPGKAQLDLTQDLLSCTDVVAENGTDCRNYGILDGIPEAKDLFAQILEVPAQNVLVAGNSSLNLMYDAMMRAMVYGVCGREPWCRQKVKFLCPAPGYDRHFAICESLGMEMITIPMTEDGPDMDLVESLVKEDESIKGIWCVPKYSNPQGYVYSDETIARLAALEPKAEDFRIFWDNAYVVHYLADAPAKQANIFTELKKNGKEDMVYLFTSTSKISFPGAGVAVIAASDRNMQQIKSIMGIQTIGHDKINQLRHVKYFKDAQGVLSHMEHHAQVLRPKFQMVLDTLEEELSGLGIAAWTKPQGGYFISLEVMEGCAKRVFALAKAAGVTLTGAGATFPYGIDPKDSNLRLAPTFPENEELAQAIAVLCLCVKLAALEKLTA